ncbi:putative PIN and TRAM-domain containing protein YacL [Pullulanibacillus camelliae]|uniref:Putative PIN and TRAM-domain containing protein YacL n=1 Tax=Pullulanibacillus camelliae TaxID=1707096 RepID=A0A8J3E174_9BACL|nr:PIN/TRAM domain-containing protein [Pullulanibacillus camelliae]GGE56777.1 putative PIN and TRAM-domain containing protein YacL [Pullulanibacillus camelliae]
MMKRMIQLFFIIIGGTLGYVYIHKLLELLNVGENLDWLTSPYVGAVVGAVIFFLLTQLFVDSLVNAIKVFEEKVIKAPVTDVLFGTFGLVFGLIVAFLVQGALNNFNLVAINTVIPIFIYLFLGYFGFQIGFKKRDELINLFPISSRSKDKKKDNDDEGTFKKLKILDTSVIIDGRIADICQTGFLEGILVIPRFVLEELQHIADSSDVLKRNRGRRGLDILNKIQKELSIKVEIYEGNFEDIAEVDSKLVQLAKLVSGVVVTNDFNLNKVCELQGVDVLNINDLANAVKPIVLPGEELKVQVIKDGKEHNQGIGYLDDGTMIVVEDGRTQIGKTIDVIVTSVLQTSAGRMIFAKPKLLEQAL